MFIGICAFNFLIINIKHLRHIESYIYGELVGCPCYARFDGSSSHINQAIRYFFCGSRFCNIQVVSFSCIYYFLYSDHCCCVGSFSSSNFYFLGFVVLVILELGLFSFSWFLIYFFVFWIGCASILSLFLN
jgi:hypothetical protein